MGLKISVHVGSIIEESQSFRTKDGRRHPALGLGEILEKVKVCTWNSGSHFFGSKIQF